MNYLNYFIETWLPTLKKQFREAKNYNERQVLKNNIYRNTQLTERQKDMLWRKITAGVEL